MRWHASVVLVQSCFGYSCVREQFSWAQKMMPLVEFEALHAPGRGEAEAVLSSVFGADQQSLDAARDELCRADGVRTLADALSAPACAALVAYADDEMDRQLDLDNTDRLPDFQVNIDFEDDLAAVIGRKARDGLRALPATAFGGAPARFERVGAFVRRYSADERPYMKFHADGNAFTANVALTPSDQHGGGDLVALYDSKCRVVDRTLGAASVHSGALCHGVAPLTQGRRYALLLFFHERDR